MTDVSLSTSAPAIPRRGFLRRAGVAALAIPVAVTGAAATNTAFPKLQRLIEAHVASYAVMGDAGAAWDAAEGSAPREPVPTVASFKRSYDSTNGREEILKRIADDFESAASRMRQSHMAELLSQSEIDGALARLEALGQSALADAHRFFEEETARALESPVGRARAAWDAALKAEDAAYVAVLAYCCQSVAEAEQKALYIAGTENFQASAPEEHHFYALVNSALPAVKS